VVGGRIKQQGLEKIREGDEVIMVVDFADRSVVWYRNGHPVGYFEGFEGAALYPAVVMGHRGYQDCACSLCLVTRLSKYGVGHAFRVHHIYHLDAIDGSWANARSGIRSASCRRKPCRTL